MEACPVCGLTVRDVGSLAAHLVGEAERSDIAHVMWLNRNLTKHRVGVAQLAVLLEQYAGGGPAGEDRVVR
jgi:hypothetical protein